MQDDWSLRINTFTEWRNMCSLFNSRFDTTSQLFLLLQSNRWMWLITCWKKLLCDIWLNFCGDRSSVAKWRLSKESTLNFVANLEKLRQKLWRCCVMFMEILPCPEQERLNGTSDLWKAGRCGGWSKVREALHFQVGMDKETVCTMWVVWWTLWASEGVCQNGAKVFRLRSRKCNDWMRPETSFSSWKQTTNSWKTSSQETSLDLSIWPRNKTTKSPVEKCILTQTKGPACNVRKLKWCWSPSLTITDWCIMSLFLKGKQVTNSSTRKLWLALSTKSFKNEELSGHEKNLYFAWRQRFCPHSPQRETLFGPKRNHHIASSTLFAGLSPVWFLSFSKTERDSQGDTLRRSRGYQDQRDESP